MRPMLWGVGLVLVGCGSVNQRDALTAACLRVHTALEKQDQLCFGAFARTPAQGDFVASCVGLASSSGALVTSGELDACAQSLQGCTLDPPVRCVGEGPNLLFPNHEKAGSGGSGAACVADLQCTSAHCGGAGDCGHCLAPKEPGSTCDPQRDFCTGSSHCLGGRCIVPGADEGASCSTYGGGNCGAPFYCQASSGMDGTCKRRGAAGEACSAVAPCADGLGCVGDLCRTPLRDGAACAVATDFCGETRFSSCVQGTCASPAAGRPEGAACDVLGCRLDLVCRTGVCALPAAPGEACDSARPCAAHSDCAPSGTCVARPPAGSACTDLSLCARGAACVGFHANGSTDPGTCPCAAGLRCLSGRCAAWSAEQCQ